MIYLNKIKKIINNKKNIKILLKIQIKLFYNQLKLILNIIVMIKSKIWL